MRIVLNKSMYDSVSRLSRYYVPLVGSLYVLITLVTDVVLREGVVAFVIFTDLFLGLILLLARARWRANDTLIIDDRDEAHMTFGFESGRRLQELKHGKIMTLKIRRLGEEVRDDFEAYSDHQ